MVEKFMIENSGVEKSGVEKFLLALGLENSWLKGLRLKLGVEMSFNHVAGHNIVFSILSRDT